MKKIIVLILALVLMLSLVSGCGKSAAELHDGAESSAASETSSQSSADESRTASEEEAEKITVTIVTDVDSYADNYLQAQMRGFVASNVELKLIQLPEKKAEYDMTADNIRVQIMAGEGPDGFLLHTYRLAWDDDRKHVSEMFGNVEKTMHSRVFLSLDDLFAKSDLMDLDEHMPIIMEQGKMNGEQYVLPLDFTFPLVVLSREKLNNSALEITPETGMRPAGEAYLSERIRGEFSMQPEFFFSKLADYETDSLLIDENDLQTLADEIDVRSTMVEESDLGDVWSYFERSTSISALEAPIYLDHEEWQDQESYLTFPQYNEKGGITAMIQTYAAVNANSTHPEEVFPYLAVLFNKDFQNDKGCKGLSANYFRPETVFFDMGLPTAIDNPYLSGLEPFMEQITDARFYSELDGQLFTYFLNYNTSAELSISEMKMMLAE